VCNVTADMWWNLENAFVNVATDTHEQRISSRNWVIMGSVATGFMVACTVFGWWHQKTIREQYMEVVEDLD